MTIFGGDIAEMAKASSELHSAMPRLKNFNRVSDSLVKWQLKLKDCPDFVALQEAIGRLSSVTHLRVDVRKGQGFDSNVATLIAALPYNVKQRKQAAAKSMGSEPS